VHQSVIAVSIPKHINNLPAFKGICSTVVHSKSKGAKAMLRPKASASQLIKPLGASSELPSVGLKRGSYPASSNRQPPGMNSINRAAKVIIVYSILEKAPASEKKPGLSFLVVA
jgi:hypothetical protein